MAGCPPQSHPAPCFHRDRLPDKSIESSVVSRQPDRARAELGPREYLAACLQRKCQQESHGGEGRIPRRPRPLGSR